MKGKLSLMALLVIYPITGVLAKEAPKDYKHMAVNYPQENKSFMGWSVGGGVGLNTATANINGSTVTTDDVSPFLSGEPNPQSDNVGRAIVSKFGPMGNLFVGYGTMRDIYFAGIDVGVNFIGAYNLQNNSTSSVNTVITDGGAVADIHYTNSLTTQTKVSRSWAQGFIDLKLGGLITPETLAYGLIGTSYSSATVKSNTNYFSCGVSSAGTDACSDVNFSYQKTKYFFGLRLGAGMEVLLTDNIGVGAEYVYTFYPSFVTNAAATRTGVACDMASGCAVVSSEITNYTRTTLNDQQAMAKFTYHLGC